MKENILLISYYFAPNNGVGAKRFSYLSKFLFNEGIKPHILTIKEKYISQIDNSLVSDGIIHRTFLLPGYPIGKWKKLSRAFEILFGQIDNYIGWVLPGIIKGFLLIKKHKFEIVIVTGPPFSSFLIPYVISFFLKFKFILDYRDPWILYLNNDSNFKRKINWFVEKKILRRADLIIFNTKNAMNGYSELNFNFYLKEKSRVIPNGYIEHSEIHPKIINENKKTVIYAGNFYGGRSITYLFGPISKLNLEGKLNFNNFSIHLFGIIPDQEWERISSYNFPPNMIVRHERIGYIELLQYLKGAAVLYLSQGNEHKYSVPFKLIDYLSIKKPILALTSKHSATYNIMKETNCGEVADISESNSIYNALKNILMEGKKYSFDGREKYSIERVFNNYLQIINSI